MLARLATAKFLAEYGMNRILKRGADGKPRVIQVPGHDGKDYIVIIRRVNGKLTGECLLETGAGQIWCKGNLNGVCYHTVSALRTAVMDAGWNVLAVCQTKLDADLRSRIGGQVQIVSNDLLKAELYFIVEDSKWVDIMNSPSHPTKRKRS